MRPRIVFLLVLMISIATLLPAQPVAPARKTVLILLRQPEGPLGQRLTTIGQSIAVPEEVRQAAGRERAALAAAQQESFNTRLAAAGATGVIHYPGLNMVHAELPAGAEGALASDPAVLSLTPLSEDAPLGVGVQPPVGTAGGPPGRKSEMLHSPFLMPALSPGFIPSPQMPGQMQMPGQLGLPGAMPPVMPGATGGGMFQSLLGVTAQVGAQTGMMMPRAGGMLALVAGGAQIAQVIAANRRQTCTISLQATTAAIPASGGQGTFIVQASPSCLWQAQTDAEWLKVESDGPVVGPGVVRYTAAPASGTNRTAVIVIAGIARMTIKGKTSLTLTQSRYDGL